MEIQQKDRYWQESHKKKLISIIITIVLGVVLSLYLASCTCHVDTYNRFVFHPYQLVRAKVLMHIPLSIGDIIYVCLGGMLIVYIVKLIAYLVRWQRYKIVFIWYLLTGAGSLATLYFLFLLSWGGNYYKEPLGDYWQMDKNKWNDSSVIQFDRYLVQEINTLAPAYRNNTLDVSVAKAKEFYKKETDCFYNSRGVLIKPSLFGSLLRYMGVQGYYNPFTGEGQVDDGQPGFMLPYVITHELAHQAGIAAEDDANLLAYAVSMQSQDTSFMYSACLNVWLYTHFQLRMRDSAAANAIRKQLNPITLAHLDTLRQLRIRYRNRFGNYTGDVYDRYLKMNHQQDGIESYDKVTVSAWLWELRRRSGIVNKIYIP